MKKLNLFYCLLLMTFLLCINIPVKAQNGDGFPSQSELEKISLEDLI